MFYIFLSIFTMISFLFGGILYLVTNFSRSTKTSAVICSGYESAQVGSWILDKGGNAVDAAIATLFCEGLAMPQSMGLGGGFLMTIYNKETGKAITLNARETAPLAATENMFVGQEKKIAKGGLSVAVPGELRGYWYAYKEFGGKLPWKDLVQPAIDLCRSGTIITGYLEQLLQTKSKELKRDPGLREVFIDEKTGEPKLKDQYIQRLRLAETLEVIAQEGGDALHNGSLTQQFVHDIQNAGGIITEEDLNIYTPEWQEPITVNLGSNEMLYTSPLPGSGVILGFILNVLKNFLDFSNPDLLSNYQRIVETFKFAYAERSKLGDKNFVYMEEILSNLLSSEYASYIQSKIKIDKTYQDPSYYGLQAATVDDSGTAHICVLAPNGDAVSVTSTINLYFGAGFMSISTGIILNDQMDDFSSPNLTNCFNLPPSSMNCISPGKRPLSSMCPSIVVGNKGDVKLIVGAAGGSKITSSVALIIIRNIWYGYAIEDAIRSSRLHHQLLPMQIQFEESFKDKPDIITGLHEIGHLYHLKSSAGFSAATAIGVNNGEIQAVSDHRRVK